MRCFSPQDAFGPIFLLPSTIVLPFSIDVVFILSL